METKIKDNEQISFTIISYAGIAKSKAILAIKAALEYDFDKYKDLIKKAEKSLVEAEQAHMTLVQKEAKKEVLPFSMLLLHAEDIMMSAQTFIDLGANIMQQSKKLAALENRILDLEKKQP